VRANGTYSVRLKKFNTLMKIKLVTVNIFFNGTSVFIFWSSSLLTRAHTFKYGGGFEPQPLYIICNIIAN